MPMTPYKPTVRDNTARRALELLGDTYANRKLVRNIFGSSGIGAAGQDTPLGFGVVDATPVGLGFMAQEAGRQAGQGHPWAAAANLALAALPIPGKTVVRGAARAVAGKAKGMIGKTLKHSLPVPDGTSAALDMSQSARMARAGEQGFSTPAYHGTEADVREFTTTRQKSVAPGDSYYFSADPENAASYAGADREIQESIFQAEDARRRISDLLFAGAAETDPQIVNLRNIERQANAVRMTRKDGPAGANIMPVLLRLGRTKDIDAEGRKWLNLNDGNNDTGRLFNPRFDGDPQTGRKGPNGELAFIPDPRGKVQNRTIHDEVRAAQASGNWDSLAVRNVIDAGSLEAARAGKPGTTYVMLDPSNIRSQFNPFHPGGEARIGLPRPGDFRSLNLFRQPQR